MQIDNFSKVQLIPSEQFQNIKHSLPVNQQTPGLQITLGDFMSKGVTQTRQKRRRINPVVVPLDKQAPISHSNSLGNLPPVPQQGEQHIPPGIDNLSDHSNQPPLPFASELFIDNGFPSLLDDLDQPEGFGFEEGVDPFITGPTSFVFDFDNSDFVDLEAGSLGEGEYSETDNDDDLQIDNGVQIEIVSNEELERQAIVETQLKEAKAAAAKVKRDAVKSAVKSGACTVASYLAPLGAVVGVFAGIFQRVLEEIPPDMVDKALCRVSQGGVLGAVNDVMQTMIKGGAKYAPPLLPIAVICGTILYRTGKGADNWSVNSVWNSFKDQVQQAPVREMAMAVSLVALAVISALTEGSWAGTIPYIFDSSDPSGHVMMQIVLGLALVQAARASSLYGNKTIAAVTYAYGGVMAVANAIFLSRTAYACHTIQEIQEGFKWAAAVFTGSRLTVGLSNAAINTGLAVKQLKADVVEMFARG